MAGVRRTPTDTLPCPIKYTTRHIKMVEEAGDKQNRPCAEIFLEEWGCSGRKRPTLADLLNLLIKAEQFTAADFVAVNLLKEPRPTRPISGHAAEVKSPFIEPLQLSCPFPPSAPPPSNSIIEGQEKDDNIISRNHDRSIEANSVDESVRIAQQLETMPLEQVEVCSPKHIMYKDLQLITNNFNDQPLGESDGRLLGKGAFGSVHLAIQGNNLTAVKRLNKEVVNIERHFRNEVEALMRVQHPNLLGMLAYSCDGPEYCLIYEYMSQGNLEERLSRQGRWEKPLFFFERIRIAYGTAKGLKHLHEYSNPPLVHRDVKSANILLGRDLVPKLGDFGLVRLGSSGEESSSAALTTTVFGTSVYMAPETFEGDVSVKTDVFSFGVVLLELLTGLSPFNADGKGLDLVSHVNDVCDESNTIGSLLDTNAGNWTSDSGNDLSVVLYLLAKDCLEDKQNRPVMPSVLRRLETVHDQQ